MKRIVVIGLVSYLAFALEFLLYNFWGVGQAEFLILVVIFFNLYLGIRFSIIAAVFCGIFKDASWRGSLWDLYFGVYRCGLYDDIGAPVFVSAGFKVFQGWWLFLLWWDVLSSRRS